MDKLIAPILAEIKRRGLSEAAVSQRAVGNPSALKNLRVRRGGGTRNHPIDNLLAIANSLGLEVAIKRLSDEAGFAEAPPPSPLADRYFVAPESDSPIAAAMAFSDHWFSALNIDSKVASMHAVDGDWMRPTIPLGATVMIDHSRTDPEPGGQKLARKPAPVFMCEFSGETLLCRAERQDSTNYMLSFDNPAYPPCSARVLDVRIFGQAVWFGHALTGQSDWSASEPSR